MQTEAEHTYDYYVARGSHLVLMDGEIPLAMAGSNAQLTDIVRLGSARTPSTLRGKGDARRAVGLHLAQAAQRAVKLATLSSSSDMAAHAYEADGFERIGEWPLIRFDGSQTLGPS